MIDFRHYLKLQARRSQPREYSQTHQAIDQDWALALARFPLPPRARVLDLGTRDGYGVEVLTRAGMDAIGVELIETVARYARRQGRNVVSMDMHNLLFADESFDLLVTRHSLEHTLDYRQVLAECARVLKPGGGLFIVIPIESRQPHQLHTQPFTTPEQLPGALRQLGFELLFEERIPPRENPAIDWEQRVVARKPPGMPRPRLAYTVPPNPAPSMPDRWRLAAKIWLKHWLGRLRLALDDASVDPPEQLYQGVLYTPPRMAAIQFLEGWAPRVHGKVLDVGVGSWTLPRRLLQDRCQYLAVDVFEHPNIDIVADAHALEIVFTAETFDFLLCFEVIEHLAHPALALGQMHRLLKPGGRLLLTTPFRFHLHGGDSFKDYWRFTEDGLRLLFQEAGFREVMIAPVGPDRFPYSYMVAAEK